MEVVINSYQSHNSGSSSVSAIYRLLNPTSSDGLAPPCSVVLDNDKGKLVMTSPAAAGKKKVCEAKALAALKNHSEAERRRRERINAHLATLRALVPSTAKMDKATLLGEVISQVKELKKIAVEASKGFVIPTDADEVKVEPHEDEGGCGSMGYCYSYKASLCCEYRPELLSELRQTFDALQLELVKAQVSTLGDRVKNEFVYRCKGEACQLVASTVQRALTSLMDKASTSLDYSLTTSHPTKRPRLRL